MELKQENPYFDLHQNPVLGKLAFVTSYQLIWLRGPFAIFPAQDFAHIVGNRYGMVTLADGTSASTDFVRHPFDLLVRRGK
jgi:hypothetical protein